MPCCSSPTPAAGRANFHLRSPYAIDLGELELEHNGDAQWDSARVKNGATSYTVEIGTGANAWWHTEMEFGFNGAPGEGMSPQMTGVVTENTFSLTTPGENWIDAGFYAEYAQATSANTPIRSPRARRWRTISAGRQPRSTCS